LSNLLKIGDKLGKISTKSGKSGIFTWSLLTVCVSANWNPIDVIIYEKEVILRGSKKACLIPKVVS